MLIVWFSIAIFCLFTGGFDDSYIVYVKISMGVVRAVVVLLFLISLLILLGIPLLHNISGGLHNIRYCDVELFDKMDSCNKSNRKNNVYYLNQIRMIDIYYKHGKVDNLVKENELETLLKRKDFLEKKKKFSDDFISYAYSLLISVMASYICTAFSSKEFGKNIVTTIIILFTYIAIILIKYVERGEGGSYNNQIWEYELKLLDRKIEELGEKVKLSPDDEKMLLTKEFVVEELDKKKRKARKKKKKELIENEIKVIENLELCLSDYSNYVQQCINLEGKDIYLFYKKGKTNKYLGERNLATQDYVTLYKILKKYAWIK